MPLCRSFQPSAVAPGIYCGFFAFVRQSPTAGIRRAMPHKAFTNPTMLSHQPRLRQRFAVLKTGHASDYTERTHGGYGQMLVRLLRDEDGNGEERGESWDVFSVVDGDFSFLERSGQEEGKAGNPDYYDGYVLTGSAADAHATDVDWINRLCDALVLLHCQRKKLLGICFGHQILARALGGRTGRAQVGWELGIKSLNIDSEKVSQLYGLALPSTLNAIESHQDQVIIAPPDALVLASSEKTKIEMFAIGHHVLCMQCHPEFSEDVMMDIIQSRLSREIISDEVAKGAVDSFERSIPDQDLLQVLCKRFLKGCP